MEMWYQTRAPGSRLKTLIGEKRSDPTPENTNEMVLVLEFGKGVLFRELL